MPDNAGDAGDLSSIPELGRSPGEENGHPLQYSCQDNPLDRGAWWATICGIAASDTTEWLNTQTYKHTHRVHLTNLLSWIVVLNSDVSAPLKEILDSPFYNVDSFLNIFGNIEATYEWVVQISRVLCGKWQLLMVCLMPSYHISLLGLRSATNFSVFSPLSVSEGLLLEMHTGKRIFLRPHQCWVLDYKCLECSYQNCVDPQHHFIS